MFQPVYITYRWQLLKKKKGIAMMLNIVSFCTYTICLHLVGIVVWNYDHAACLMGVGYSVFSFPVL